MNPTDTRCNSRFLRAARRESVDATPVWLMRQAGRYMAEYRALRERYSMMELIQSPELAHEVTMQPINAFDLDAAIIFADILPLLAGMGFELDFVEGSQPVIHNPVRKADDIAQLRVLPPEETLAFTLEAISITRRELDARGIPLIGFSGAPYTLATYAVEGFGSPNHHRVKNLMFSDPVAWDALMSKISEAVGAYLLAQAEAGADALQLFDSWVGDLSPDQYRDFVLPYTQRALKTAAQAGVPLIHFGTDTSGMLDLVREAGGDVIGVDWRIRLSEAWARLGDGVALQGNLDPVALLAPWDALEKQVKGLLNDVSGRAGHIFNLGHGILPQTPVDNVRRLVDFVHEQTGA